LARATGEKFHEPRRVMSLRSSTSR
jgi:hypothetical protein